MPDMGGMGGAPGAGAAGGAGGAGPTIEEVQHSATIALFKMFWLNSLTSGGLICPTPNLSFADSSGVQQ